MIVGNALRKLKKIFLVPKKPCQTKRWYICKKTSKLIILFFFFTLKNAKTHFRKKKA